MKAPRLPPLNALRAFDLAGRLGSFVAAADALHVTQPAIARQIRTLEQWLGRPLFERHARGVELTEAGRRYHDRIGQALAAIDEATQDFSAQPDRSWIRLVAVPGFVSRWLRPRLGGFVRAHPGLRVAVEPAAVLTELPVQRADLGVAYGEPGDFPGPTEVLLRPPVFPVCAPSLLARLGQPSSVRALLRWPLLHEDDGSWWAQWFERLGVRARPVSCLAHASADDVMSLALAGEGVALSNPLLARDDLEAGRLVRPLPHACLMQCYLLLCPAQGLGSQALLLATWLRTALEAETVNAEATGLTPRQTPPSVAG